MEHLLAPNHGAQDEFVSMHKAFGLAFPKPDGETADAVNWAVDEAISCFDNAASRADRVGVVAYMVVRLRNSLMHVMDADLFLYADHSKTMRAIGLAFGMLRISKHGSEKTVASL